MLQDFISWILTNYIELAGTVAGLIYLYFSIKEKIWLWLFGFISSAIYVYVAFQNKIYADMGIYLYYVVISVFGWYKWKYSGESKSENLPIKRLNYKSWLISLGATLLLFLLLGVILDKYTDSDIPYLDAFTTSASIVATYMLVRKILEQWLFWIVIDGVSIGLYFYKELYSVIVLYSVYTIMAFVGYVQWKKHWLRKNHGQA